MTTETTTTTPTTEQAGGNAEAQPKKTDFVLASEEKVQAETEAAKAAEAPPKKAPPAGDDEPDTDTETAQDDAAQKKKRPGGWQRKIEKLEAENAALKAAGGPTQKDPLNPTPVTDLKKPVPTDFKIYDDYVDAVADWKAQTAVQKALKERDDKVQTDASKKERSEKAEKFNQQKDESRKLHEDFDDVLSEFDDVPVHPEIGNALLDSDHGAEVAYYLAKNSDEFDKLNQPHVSKVTVRRAIDAIEAKLSAQSPDKKSEPVKTSKAPPPVAPVGKGKSSGSVDPETADYETYKAWRLKNKTR